MKTNLLSLFLVLLLATSCTYNNDLDYIKKYYHGTAKEALTNEGWSEVGTVTVYKNTYDKMESYDTTFTIYYKDGHYVAVDKQFASFNATRYSVTKGNYSIGDERYNGRISYEGSLLYFYF